MYAFGKTSSKQTDPDTVIDESLTKFLTMTKVLDTKLTKAQYQALNNSIVRMRP